LIKNVENHSMCPCTHGSEKAPNSFLGDLGVLANLARVFKRHREHGAKRCYHRIAELDDVYKGDAFRPTLEGAAKVAHR
jgi:hypothetical protein